MKLSVVIPAHNEAGSIAETLRATVAALDRAEIDHELVVIDDASVDGTAAVVEALAAEHPQIRCLRSHHPRGFGYAVRSGLERFEGDAVAVMMADGSDDPADLVRYHELLDQGYDCVFGSRFMRQSQVYDYPRLKLVINRAANWFVRVLFRHHFNDTTNAFKAYRREVIQTIQPLLSNHFNLTVEMPLKAIVRGHSFAVIPISWRNRTSGQSKLAMREMGSRYLFIVLYVFLEHHLSRGDYPPAPLLTMARIYTAEARRAGGWRKLLGRAQREGIAACVERPQELEVVSHNHRVCRFTGWAVAAGGRDVSLRVHGPAGEFEVLPGTERPDVFAVYGQQYGLADDRVGFQFYVDVPALNGDDPPGVTLEFSDGRQTVRSDRFRFAREADPAQVDTYVGDGAPKRELALRRLAGRGLEIGALHQPLEVDQSKCEMSYADRLTRAQAVAMFPELAPHAHRMVEPDVLIDVATEDLDRLREHDFDFLVANDVIEHLPNPIRFLQSVAAAMKPGALFFLSVPDRDFTFDVTREVTPLGHLWREYEAGVDYVDDDHIRDFLDHTETEEIPADPEERRRLFEHHRRRSIHVHVWDQASFDAMLDDAIDKLRLGLVAAERIPSREADGSMVYLLEKRQGAGPER